MDYNNSFYTIKVPEASKWYVELAGNTYRVYPRLGQEPNRFYRFMQGLLLGFKWKKDI